MSTGTTKGKTKKFPSADVSQLFVFEVQADGDDSSCFSLTSPRKNVPLEEVISRQLRRLKDVRDISKVQFSTPDNQIIPHGTCLDQIACSKCLVTILPGATVDRSPASQKISSFSGTGGSPKSIPRSAMVTPGAASVKQGVFARAGSHPGRKDSSEHDGSSKPSRSKYKIPSGDLTGSSPDILDFDPPHPHPITRSDSESFIPTPTPKMLNLSDLNTVSSLASLGLFGSQPDNVFQEPIGSPRLNLLDVELDSLASLGINWDTSAPDQDHLEDFDGSPVPRKSMPSRQQRSLSAPSLVAQQPTKQDSKKSSFLQKHDALKKSDKVKASKTEKEKRKKIVEASLTEVGFLPPTKPSRATTDGTTPVKPRSSFTDSDGKPRPGSADGSNKGKPGHGLTDSSGGRSSSTSADSDPLHYSPLETSQPKKLNTKIHTQKRRSNDDPVDQEFYTQTNNSKILLPSAIRFESEAAQEADPYAMFSDPLYRMDPLPVTKLCLGDLSLSIDEHHLGLHQSDSDSEESYFIGTPTAPTRLELTDISDSLTDVGIDEALRRKKRSLSDPVTAQEGQVEFDPRIIMSNKPKSRISKSGKRPSVGLNASAPPLKAVLEEEAQLKRTTTVGGVKTKRTIKPKLERTWKMSPPTKFDTAWKKNGSAYTKVLKRGDSDYLKFASFFEVMLHGNGLKIKSVEAIYNQGLSESFNHYRAIMTSRRDGPDGKKFFKKTYTNDPQKVFVAQEYDKKVALFDWNAESTDLPIIPVCHGTDYEVAKKICQTGFSTLASLDSGYYGQGMYFSTNAKYTLPYFATKRNPTIIICFVTPGNAFPVTEPTELMGAPIIPGYQSHYVVTDQSGKPSSIATRCDELVIGQEAQVIPAYVIQFDHQDITGELQNWQRVIYQQLKNDGKDTKESGGIFAQEDPLPTPSSPSVPRAAKEPQSLESSSSPTPFTDEDANSRKSSDPPPPSLGLNTPEQHDATSEHPAPALAIPLGQEPEGPMVGWSVQAVSGFLLTNLSDKTSDIHGLINLFQSQQIDGLELLLLSEESMKIHLNLTLGVRKKIDHFRAKHIQQFPNQPIPQITCVEHTKSLREWTPHDVHNSLNEIGLHSCSQNFFEQKFDGIEIHFLMENGLLGSYGISTFGEISKLQRLLKKFPYTSPPPPSDTKFYSSPIDTWTTKEVGEALRYCGLEEFVECFESQDIDGSILMELSEQELKEDLGVVARAHIIKLSRLRIADWRF